MVGKTNFTDDDEVGEIDPEAAVVVVVEDRFLGDVAVPDEEELAEGDVGPEDGEAEKKFAHEVEMFRVQGDGENRRSEASR